MSEHAPPQDALPQPPAQPARRSSKLYVQLVVLVAIVVAASALVTAWYTQQRLAAKGLAALNAQAVALAQGAASAVAHDLARRDVYALEQRIAQLGKLPGVHGVALYTADGHHVVSVMTPDDEVLSAAPSAAVVPPANGKAELRNVRGHAEAWEPVLAPGLIGWVRVQQDATAGTAAGRHIWRDSLLSSSLIGLSMIGVLALYMRRALRPLERAAGFAKSLAQRPGAVMAVERGSREIEQMSLALNEASTRLAAQYEALIKRDRELQAVLDTSGDAVVGVDGAGRIRLFNAVATSIFGLSAEQATDQPLETVLPGLTPLRLVELVASGVRTGSSARRVARFDAEGVRNGGTRFPVEASVGEADASSSLRYTLTMRDVTEKRLTEDTLRVYVRALENSSCGTMISDARLPGAPMMYANAAFTSITGYETGEAFGRSLSFLQGDDRAQPQIQTLREAMVAGRPVEVTLRNYRKDGQPFWNQLAIAPVRDESGALTHFVGAITDLTQRVEAEKAVARRNEQLDLILELSPDGFVLFDRADELVYASSGFCRMSGLSRVSLPQGLRVDQLDDLLRALADPKLPWPALWADGDKPRQILLVQPERRVLQVQVRRGEASGDRVLFVRDVTRETEVDRMKSEFLSTAAHELRTPMVSIYGFSELLLHRGYDAQKSKPMVQTIHRQSGLIVSLINELLDLARIEARQGKDFRIDTQALQPIVEEAARSILVPNDDRKVQVVAQDDPLWVAVDSEKLRQAVINLLSNAYKYSPQGGAISVEVARGAGSRHGEVCITVRDRGIGMSPEQLTRAFERFYRADPSGNIPGTGLGLCIVKEIVELLGGSISLASTPGEGTAATIWLPLREAPASHTAVDVGAAVA